MSSFYYLFLFGNILLIGISLTNAVPLDGNCTKKEDCDQPGGLICSSNACKCDTPWYQPCNTGCVTQSSIIYQGQECRVDSNCVVNARCDNTSTCVCNVGFSAFNGLCYKKNDQTCVNDNECWSQQCNGICTCRTGYEPLNDGRCKIKLARLYSNWTQANQSNDFCFDDSSCLNAVAVCRNDSINSGKFCQCPSPGYNTDINNQKCEIILTNQLSPSDQSSLNGNATCGYCQDINAVCTLVGNQQTCWCRAGYDKIGNQCGSIRNTIIFPSSTDPSIYSFCPSSYQFDSTTRSCKPIERQWINDNFQYGLCTRITSNGIAQTPNNGLCPAPLQCLPNGDKYVCTCGTDQIIEQLPNQRCVYRLGKNAVNQSISCPTNANRINNICQCKGGYKSVNGDQGCGLILSTAIDLNGCNGNISSNPCVSFGGAAVLCQVGECRCDPPTSFASEDNSVCYGFLSVTQAPPIYCPPNSAVNLTSCECNTGYRQVSERRCEPKSLLYNLNDVPDDVPPKQGDLAPGDCEVLYGEGLAPYNDTIKACRCDATSFKSPDGTQCWPLLYTPLIQSMSNCSTPNAYGNNSNQCVCDRGFRPSNSSNKDCARITTPLNMNIPNVVSNVDPINDNDCRELFGQLSTANQSQCICPTNVSFANNNGSRCYAFLNITTALDTLGNSSCPDNAAIQPSSPGICQCNPGFIQSETNRTCLTRNIILNDTKIRLSSSNCINYKNIDCSVKYGDGSFCDNDQCWCDDSKSFKTNNQCQSFSSYYFPGFHERNNFSCDTVNDCVSAGIDINTVTCSRINSGDDYKVCICNSGWFLNPETQKCETRCPSNCNGRPNSVCNGYNCLCTAGFIEVNGACIGNQNIIKLYQPCNTSFIPQNNEPFQCTSCNRGGCASSFKDTGSQCVIYNFDTDYCASFDFCSSLIANSGCSRDDNKCICSTKYYREENTCVLPVDARCAIDAECGANKNCTNQRCRCSDGKTAVDTQDAFGRSMQRCINVNGVDQIRFNPVLFFCIVLVRIFFS